MLERLSRNWSATHTQIASKELVAVDLQIQIEILFVLTRLLRLRCARWLAVGHGLGQLVKSRRGQLRSSFALPLDNQPVLPPLSSQDAIRHTTFDDDSRALSVTISFSTLSSQFSPKNKVPTQWLILSLSCSPSASVFIDSITNRRAMGQSTENIVLRTWQMDAMETWRHKMWGARRIWPTVQRGAAR